MSKIIGVKQIDICASYGGNPSTYIYRVQTCTFPLGDLVAVCNKYHILISWFIVPEDKVITDKACLPSREELIWQGEWKPIENKFGNFGEQFAKAKGVGYESAARMCGIAISSYYNLWLNDEKRWRKIGTANFLKVINNSGVYPGEYVRDDNAPIKMVKGFSEIGYNRSDVQDKVTNEHYFKRLVISNNRMQSQIKQMREELDALKTELIALRGDTYIHRAAEDGPSNQFGID